MFFLIPKLALKGYADLELIKLSTKFLKCESIAGTYNSTKVGITYPKINNGQHESDGIINLRY